MTFSAILTLPDSIGLVIFFIIRFRSSFVPLALELQTAPLPRQKIKKGIPVFFPPGFSMIDTLSHTTIC